MVDVYTKIGILDLLDGPAFIICNGEFHGVDAGRRFKKENIARCDCHWFRDKMKAIFDRFEGIVA